MLYELLKERKTMVKLAESYVLELSGKTSARLDKLHLLLKMDVS